MQNMLFEKIEYKIEKTDKGTWRRYVYPNGAYFAEYKSNSTWMGLPMIHYTRGICPETGKRIVAKGVLAVGKLAVGIFALGHASAGLFAVGQLGVGLLFGLGQASSGLVSIGQLAVGFYFGIGQVATGVIAIGQFAAGKYVLAQVGFGEHVWSTKIKDPEAIEFFQSTFTRFMAWWKGAS